MVTLGAPATGALLPPLSTADAEEAFGEDRGLQSQLGRVQAVLEVLERVDSYELKERFLVGLPEVDAFLYGSRVGTVLLDHLSTLPEALDRYLLLAVIALRQRQLYEHLTLADEPPHRELLVLAQRLRGVEAGYACIGGVMGYQAACLRLLLARRHKQQRRKERRYGHGKGGAFADALRSSLPPGSRVRRPPMLDLLAADYEGSLTARQAAIEGLASVPYLAEIWPVGGAATRLGLTCPKTRKSLPAAALPYGGRTLLEWLVRDVSAREYLHYRIALSGGFGRFRDGGGEAGGRKGHASEWPARPLQPLTPIVLMTSEANENCDRIGAALERAAWHGRGRLSFTRVRQPGVPVVDAEDGRWVRDGPGAPATLPGGHGALWGLLASTGAYDRLVSRGRRGALVRQISNPAAGTDDTMLALAGVGSGAPARPGGVRRPRAFGFAACPRAPGAAEGVDVLVERQGGKFGVSCVEYTAWEGRVEAEGAAPGSAGDLPANTNVLYVDLGVVSHRMRRAALTKDASDALPGLLLNPKKKVEDVDAKAGRVRAVRAGRLEAAMQGLADAFATHVDVDALEAGPGAHPLSPSTSFDDLLADQLDTFCIHTSRRKLTSSAKRAPGPDGSMHQTPEGSFRDLQANVRDVLRMAGWELPEGSDHLGLDEGPVVTTSTIASRPLPFLVLHHPALGPLWSVVAQKLRVGRLHSGSELVLEAAEVDVEGLDIDGSLQVLCDSPLGQSRPACEAAGKVEGIAGDEEDLFVVYGDDGGRVRLVDVDIRNAGINWAAEGTLPWAHRVERCETCRIELQGRSELDAEGVTLAGDLHLTVPDGHRMTIRPCAAHPAGHSIVLEPLEHATAPSWRWRYALRDDGAIELERVIDSAIVEACRMQI